MYKKIIVVSILVLFSCSSFLLLSQNKKEMWSKAIVEKNPEKKLQFLKDYEAKYGKKKDKFHKFLYLNLSNTAFTLKKYDEAIQYGEKALTFPDLDDTNKIQMYIRLANAYKQTKTDMDKALENAGKVIEMANDFISKQGESTQDEEKKEKVISNYKIFYMAPAYRLQATILYEKDKENTEVIKQAAEKACEAYKLDKSERSSKMVFSFAYNMYKKKMTADAIKNLEVILNKEKPEYNHTIMLASLYYKLKNKTKAVNYYEMAYKAKRQKKTAMKIGRLTQKNNPLKGANYFAEAFLMGGEDKDSDAFKFLQQIYFNVIAKDKTPAEKEKGFKAFLNAARARLGMEPAAEEEKPAATEETTESEG
ncbi:MAG: hypothetical protein GY757_05125 [bacterium]|nr:hypothetical protein [bacterium]